MPTQISLIRHGMTDNPMDILYGRLPGFALDSTGKRQAVEVAQRIKHIPIAAIYSSPLLRARQTAREIQKHHSHLRVHQSILINEVRTPFEGQTGEKLKSRHGDFYTGIDSAYEQPLDILKRVRQFLWRSRRKYPGQHTIAVTHGDIILFTMLWIKGLPIIPENKMQFKKLKIIDTYPENVSVTTLSFESNDRKEIPAATYHSISLKATESDRMVTLR